MLSFFLKQGLSKVPHVGAYMIGLEFVSEAFLSISKGANLYKDGHPLVESMNRVFTLREQYAEGQVYYYQSSSEIETFNNSIRARIEHNGGSGHHFQFRPYQQYAGETILAFWIWHHQSTWKPKRPTALRYINALRANGRGGMEIELHEWEQAVKDHNQMIFLKQKMGG